MQRNLLSNDNSDDFTNYYDDEEETFNCINGYYDDQLLICKCYPGWASDMKSLNQCDIDTGLNLTKLNKDIEPPDSDKSKKNKKNNNIDIMLGIVFPFCSLLIIMLIILCVLRCVCKKCKNIISIKNIINSHKNKDKKKETKIALELSSNVNNKNENKVSFNPSKKYNTTKDDEKLENNTNSSNSKIKRKIDNPNYVTINESVEMEINYSN